MSPKIQGPRGETLIYAFAVLFLITLNTNSHSYALIVVLFLFDFFLYFFSLILNVTTAESGNPYEPQFQGQCVN